MLSTPRSKKEGRLLAVLPSTNGILKLRSRVSHERTAIEGHFYGKAGKFTISDRGFMSSEKRGSKDTKVS